ncbi:MAG TPA: trypsin-like serine protease [Solirubrobacteraceae bacterium]|nr:trypsin-like serine protease [Solirubrobacteraceae bacterium]
MSQPKHPSAPSPRDVRPPRARRLAALTGGLLAAVLALAAPAAHAVDGEPVPEGSLRFVAQVNHHYGPCSGSLIHPRWVITAEHCSYPTSLGAMNVRLGNTTLNAGGEVRIVSRIIRNPFYTGGHNDLALLELDTPVTTIEPVRLATPDLEPLWDGVQYSPFTPYDQGEISGWGPAPGSTDWFRLKHKIVDITSSGPDGKGIKSIEVGAGPCPGDSGGPLLVNWGGEQLLAGVTKAASVSCGSGNYSEVGAGANRSWILAEMAKLPYTPFGVADWDRDGHQDVIARDDARGDLWLYPGQSRRGYSGAARVRIGNGWLGFTPFGIADWDRDGHQDIVTRNDWTGDLWLYPGESRRGYSGSVPVRIGEGWTGRTAFGTGDWNGDGHRDLLARDDATGVLWLHPGRSRRGSTGIAPVSLSAQWNHYSAYGVADWDRDGFQDLIVRDNDTGNLWLHPGDPVRGTDTPSKIGNGWAGFTPFGIADWDGDGHRDIVARADHSGDLWLYPGDSRRGYPSSPQVRIGNGW